MRRFKIQGRTYRDENDGSNDGAGGNNGQNANNSDENNNNNNLISHDTLWNHDTNEDGNENNSGNGNDNANQGNDANARFQQHIDTLDFTSGVDATGILQAISEGDAEALGTALQQVGINAYRNAMVDANKVVQQRVDAASESVKNDISAQNATSEVVNAMNNELPFTKKAAYAPMAKLVLTQFLEKGANPQDAIKEVGKYFQNLSGEVGNLSQGAPNGRPASRFGGVNSSNNAGNDGAEVEDWVDFLGGPAN